MFTNDSYSNHQAYSEKPLERLHARVALAYGHLEQKQLSQALALVEEYADPIPENLTWPIVKGYLLAAKVKAGMGQTFDAVHRINLAIEKSEGLGKVAALHTMSELIQEKPDLKSALELEKRALSEGNSYFKRKKISVSERTRILETYVVPEKSVEVSRPPKTSPREFNRFGNIERESLGSGVLLNRLTASWYLDDLRVQLEWRMGFLAYLEGNAGQAVRHFDLALEHDIMLQRAQSKKFFNAHGRMMQVLNQTAMVETEEEMRGIKGDRKLAMEWADLMFMLGNYEDAASLYRRIQSAAKIKNDGASAVRAGVAEAYLIDAMNIREFRKEAPRLYGLCMAYPKAPSTPALLFKTALMSPKEPISGKEMMTQLANEYPRSRYAAKARYTNIYRFTPWKEHETRAALTEAFIEDFPKETGLIENLKKHDKRVRRLEEVGFDAY